MLKYISSVYILFFILLFLCVIGSVNAAIPNCGNPQLFSIGPNANISTSGSSTISPSNLECMPSNGGTFVVPSAPKKNRQYIK